MAAQNPPIKYFPHTTHIRVRYAETDKMGVVYYGHYATYCEVGRVEWIRHLGLTYRSLEDEYYILLPVVRYLIHFKKSAYYDDWLTIETFLRAQPTYKLAFGHEIYRDTTLLATAEVDLVFFSRQENKIIEPPKVFWDALEKVEKTNN